MALTKTTVTGLKFNQSLSIFSHDFIVSLETEMTPVYDLNLTYMAKAKVSNILKIGGGVQLARLLNAHAYGIGPISERRRGKSIPDRASGIGA